jgi:hypothetical protein
LETASSRDETSKCRCALSAASFRRHTHGASLAYQTEPASRIRFFSKRRWGDCSCACLSHGTLNSWTSSVLFSILLVTSKPIGEYSIRSL